MKVYPGDVSPFYAQAKGIAIGQAETNPPARHLCRTSEQPRRQDMGARVDVFIDGITQAC